MRSCLKCGNRGICSAFKAIINTNYLHDTRKILGFHVPADYKFLFDNEEEIYQVLAKTCKRFQNKEVEG